MMDLLFFKINAPAIKTIKSNGSTIKDNSGTVGDGDNVGVGVGVGVVKTGA